MFFLITVYAAILALASPFVDKAHVNVEAFHWMECERLGMSRYDTIREWSQVRRLVRASRDVRWYGNVIVVTLELAWAREQLK